MILFFPISKFVGTGAYHRVGGHQHTETHTLTETHTTLGEHGNSTQKVSYDLPGDWTQDPFTVKQRG